MKPIKYAVAGEKSPLPVPRIKIRMQNISIFIAYIDEKKEIK